MGVEENKATVRMFYDEVLNRGNLDVVDKVTAENYVDHTAPPGMAPGREGEKQWFAMLRAAFPDGQTMMSSIVVCPSGNAARNIANHCFSPSRPGAIPGGGVWSP